MSRFAANLRQSVLHWTRATLFLVFVVVAGVSHAADATTPAALPQWPQAHSDIPAEADVRFGVLPNGLRYAIMHNATPAGQTSLRLRIGAGSLEERDDQRGLAHFLEHMAFKGSTHVPPGEMLKILERKGLAFGPDSNAFTLFDQTFYKLDLPQSDDDRIDTGLFLLREVASELTLDQGAMDSERGVVLSEERLRDSPAKAVGDWQRNFQFEGQRVAVRDPIGLVDTLKTAPVSLIREFYDAYYRPENAVLIAVGDFDPDAMEAKIKARFSDWQGRGAPGPRPDLGKPLVRGETFRMLTLPGSSGLYGVTWVQPYDDAPDTWSTERRRMVDDIGLAILNRRLARIAEHPGAPFLSASFSRANNLHSARMTGFNLVSAPHMLDKAVGAAILEQRRIARYGVTAQELAEVLADVRTAWSAAAAGAATRVTQGLADNLMGAAANDTVFKSPRTTADFVDAAAGTITVSEVNDAVKAAFTGSGPLIAAAFPTALPEGAAGLQANYDNALAAPLADTPPPAVKPWPYDHLGDRGTVVSRQDVSDLGLTQVRFANGVRLNVKTTDFAKDEIMIAVKLGKGLIALPPNDPTPLWMAGALAAGGTQDMTADEIRDSLAGVVAGAAFAAGDAAFGFESRTQPRDFRKDLQLIAAYIARPGFRPEAVDRLKASIGVSLPALETTPDGILGKTLPLLMHRGDVRWRGTPSADELAKARSDDLPRLLRPVLASAPLEITIVGDIPVDQAIDAVAGTLGALPPREDPREVPDENRTVRAPDATPAPIVLTHKGRADQAAAYIAWPTTDFHVDQHRARTLELAAKILENRITDRVRIVEGETYTPSASSVASSDLLKFGYVGALVEIKPEKVDAVFSDIDAITADMAAHPPSQDEFDRARAPVIETELKKRQTNIFWLGLINGSQADPRRFTTARTRIGDLQSVTPEEVRRVAAKFLKPDRAWKLVVRAETVPSTASASAAGKEVIK